jgi:hypothetical protein
MSKDGMDPFEYPDEVECVGETPHALKIQAVGDKFWIPRSCLHDDSEISSLGDKGRLVTYLWLADSRGWVGRPVALTREELHLRKEKPCTAYCVRAKRAVPHKKGTACPACGRVE